MHNSSQQDFFEVNFDFNALPMASNRFEFDNTEEKFLVLQEKILSSKSNLNSCAKCFENLNLIQDLEEICKSFARHRTRLLNSFFEMYLALQEECKKSRDLLTKYQKLQQEIEENIGGLTERKVNSKIKSLKNEIKHKSNQISDLTDRLKSFEVVSEFKKKLEITETSLKEVAEKDRLILTLQQLIKEKLPGANIPTSYSCKECIKKSSDVDALQLELSRLKESISKVKVVKDVKNPLVKSMVEIQERITAWWENKQEFHSSSWKREGEDLVLNLESRVALMAEAAIEQPGRELRSAVHKKIIEVEAEFLNLEEKTKLLHENCKDNEIVQAVTGKIKDITDKFLELPYLLKPLFDLLKDYEKKELILV
jgi:gas vesicle protein/predicted DNA-binding protein YlxM (UPF0122 family)